MFEIYQIHALLHLWNPDVSRCILGDMKPGIGRVTEIALKVTTHGRPKRIGAIIPKE